MKTDIMTGGWKKCELKMGVRDSFRKHLHRRHHRDLQLLQGVGQVVHDIPAVLFPFRLNLNEGQAAQAEQPIQVVAARPRLRRSQVLEFLRYVSVWG